MGRRPLSFLAAAAATAVVVACSGDSTPTVKVTATDTACTVSRSSVGAGNVKFDVDNKGSIITEVYLYAANNRVMGEIENVDPGTTKSFTVKAGGGSYQVACKPGQTGDGIRTAFTITGAPDPTATESVDSAIARDLATLNVNVSVGDDQFANGMNELVPVKGQTVVFHVQNTSTAKPHGMAVSGPGGTPLGDTGPIAPGATAELSVTFTASGDYRAVDSATPAGPDQRSATFTVID